MKHQHSRSRFVPTAGVVAAFPDIFTKRRLDYWASQTPPIGPRFTQPAGPGGLRIYDLQQIEADLAAGCAMPSDPQTSRSMKAKPIDSALRRGRVGHGLAARTEKKRGPKTASIEGAGGES